MFISPRTINRLNLNIAKKTFSFQYTKPLMPLPVSYPLINLNYARYISILKVIKVTGKRTAENFASIRFFKEPVTPASAVIAIRIGSPSTSFFNTVMEVSCYRVRDRDQQDVPALDWNKRVRLK